MQLADLAPNFSIMRSPSNWFLIAFAMALLALIFHVFASRNSK